MWSEQPVGDILIFTHICESFRLCHALRPNKKRYRHEIWYTHSPRPYLKKCFFHFFKKVTPCAARFEKQPHHVDFSHYIYYYTCLQNFSQKRPLFGFFNDFIIFGSLIPNPKSVFGSLVRILQCCQFCGFRARKLNFRNFGKFGRDFF